MAAIEPQRVVQEIWDNRLSKFVLRVVSVALTAVAFAHIATETAAADHLERREQATSKPEHILSGIDVYKTTLKQVFVTYGKPTSKVDIPPEGVKDGVGGERAYTWKKEEMRLIVGTAYHNKHESVCSVDVWGSAPGNRLGKSGRGLALGSTLQRQKALYGTRFFVSSGQIGKVKFLLLVWHDGTQMVVDYDTTGRVSHLQLFADIE